MWYPPRCLVMAARRSARSKSPVRFALDELDPNALRTQNALGEKTRPRGRRSGSASSRVASTIDTALGRLSAASASATKRHRSISPPPSRRVEKTKTQPVSESTKKPRPRSTSPAPRRPKCVKTLRRAVELHVLGDPNLGGLSFCEGLGTTTLGCRAAADAANNESSEVQSGTAEALTRTRTSSIQRPAPRFDHGLHLSPLPDKRRRRRSTTESHKRLEIRARPLCHGLFPRQTSPESHRHGSSSKV